MAGLVRKKVTVRGKSGKTFQRSVMVRAGEAVKRTAGKVGRFVNKHKGKIAGAAALAGAAYLGIKHGSKIAGAARGVGMALNTQKHYGEKLSLRERARGVVQGARLGASMNASGDKGRLGRAAVRAAGAVDHATRHLQYGVRAYKAVRELGGNRRTAAKGAILVHRESRATR